MPVFALLRPVLMKCCGTYLKQGSRPTVGCGGNKAVSRYVRDQGNRIEKESRGSQRWRSPQKRDLNGLTVLIIHHINFIRSLMYICVYERNGSVLLFILCDGSYLIETIKGGHSLMVFKRLMLNIFRWFRAGLLTSSTNIPIS